MTDFGKGVSQNRSLPFGEFWKCLIIIIHFSRNELYLLFGILLNLIKEIFFYFMKKKKMKNLFVMFLKYKGKKKKQIEIIKIFFFELRK